MLVAPPDAVLGGRNAFWSKCGSVALSTPDVGTTWQARRPSAESEKAAYVLQFVAPVVTLGKWCLRARQRMPEAPPVTASEGMRGPRQGSLG